MKNLLSENMLRFGTKNLTLDQQRELVAKSIMETINQHNLANVIKKKLSEQSAGADLKASGMSGQDIKRVGVIDKRLGISQKYQGIAMKIVGMIMAASSGMGTNNNKIATAIKMIPANGGKDLYDAVLWTVQNSPKVKQQYGRNFNLVMEMIATEYHIVPRDTNYDSSGDGPLIGAGQVKWMDSFKSILKQYNSEEAYVDPTKLSGLN